jgi:hypothetical protein
MQDHEPQGFSAEALAAFFRNAGADIYVSCPNFHTGER